MSPPPSSPPSKVVLVTGCSKGGIGFALCEEYAAQGCRVYATARQLESMSTLSKSGIQTLVLDVTSAENIDEVVKTIIDREGRIDILVNNAGVLCVGPILDVSMDVIETTYDSNVYSVIRLCKAVIPHMAARRCGTIVNISSVGAYLPTPWGGIYGSTKAALQSLTDTLYMECSPLNVAVVAITTGSVRSNISANQADAFRARGGLPPTSLYTRFLPDIVARITMSQDLDAMPAAGYARAVVAASLARRPPRELFLGGKTRLYRTLMWFPRTLALWLFWRTFTKLSRGGSTA